MTNYIEFSAKIKEKYPEYKDVDDLVLAQKIIEKYPEYKEKVTFENVENSSEAPQKNAKKGIDLTPSGIIKNTADTALSGIFAPVTAAKNKTSIQEGFDKNKKAVEKYREENPTPIKDLLLDLAVYSRMPVLGTAGSRFTLGNTAADFIGNAALQGGVAGGLETLKNGGNFAKGAAAGTGIGLALQGIMPPVIKGGAAALEKGLESGFVRKTVPQVLEFLTSVPKKMSGRAIEKELAGQSILKEPFNKETAYKPIEEAITGARNVLKYRQGDIKNSYKKIGNEVRQKLEKTLTPEAAFDEKIASLGQKAVNGLDYLKNNAENKIIEALETLDGKIAGTDNVQNAVNSIINQFGKGGVYNSAREEAPQIINYLEGALNKEGLTLRDLHRIKERLYDLGYQADNLKQGTAAEVARGTAGQINNYLRNVSPDYAQPNDLYASIINLGRELGGLNRNTIGAKLKNYGDSSQILSGFKEKLQNLNNILPEEMRFLDDVQKINAQRTAQEQLQKTLPESILNDISKYNNAPLEVQGTLENFAPEQIEKYNALRNEEGDIRDILKTVSERYESNPKPLSDKSDVKFEKALEGLENRTGIKFLDNLKDIRAREELNYWTPGQGGGSGGHQGFGNLLRTALLGGLGTAATMAHQPAALLGIASVSPRITAKGTIRNIGKLSNSAKNILKGAYDNAIMKLEPLLSKGTAPMLQGGIEYNDYQ